MKTDIIQSMTDSFESCAHTTDEGIEFWLARELQHLLAYSEWRNFHKVLLKAKTACEISEQNIDNHFVEVNKMVDIGSGAQKEVDDIMLTRYACYLIAQNGDSKKQPIAFAQTYFAIQTRKAELIEQRLLLKAKDFATEITIFNAKDKSMNTEKAISNEHITNNKTVRNTLISRGITPENLPPESDVKKIERKLNADDKKALKHNDRFNSKQDAK